VPCTQSPDVGGAGEGIVGEAVGVSVGGPIGVIVGPIVGVIVATLGVGCMGVGAGAIMGDGAGPPLAGHQVPEHSPQRAADDSHQSFAGAHACDAHVPHWSALSEPQKQHRDPTGGNPYSSLDAA